MGLTNMPLSPEVVSQNDLSHTLNYWSGRFENWLANAALPLWWERGADHENGGFHEKLETDARPAPAARRAHVQARQSIAFTQAGNLGWPGPWREAAQHGMSYLDSNFKRRDGFFCKLVSHRGEVLDDNPALYDQGFALFAAAEMFKAIPSRSDVAGFALELAHRVEKSMHHVNGGFREFGDLPYQSKSHIPLMEAALAWCEIDSNPVWPRLADEIGNHCIGKLLDPDTMLLNEYFDENWTLLDGTGEAIEPGHHFEWSILIDRWARMKSSEDAHMMALRLFEVGAQGVEQKRGVAMDKFGADFNACCETARLWPQAERLNASLFFAAAMEGDFKQFYLENAADAAAALWRYLDTAKRGLWRDRMLADGGFVEEPAPASSLYHMVRATSALLALRDQTK
jgi:mannose/cellobiose epimerase-like protein (N-acyl-D-glucosamine 2-epimerase family)